MISPKNILPLSLLLLVACALTLSAPDAAGQAGPADPVTVDVLDGTPGNTIVKFSFTPFREKRITIDGKGYVSFLPGREGRALERGAPGLPRISRAIVIPRDVDMEITVLDRKQHEIDNVLVLPSKGNLKRDINPATVPYTFGPAYGRDAWYPERAFELRAPFILRGVRGTVVTVSPYQYNGARKTLRVTTSITLSVKARNRGSGAGQAGAALRPCRAFNQVLQKAFLNYRLRTPPGKASTRAYTEDGDMLIITHDLFNSYVQPLAAWKRSQGIATTVVNVSAIGNNRIDIQNYVQNVYNTSNLSYLLLVGDVAQVASPIEHSCLADPVYALLDGTDHFPDIFVGRFPAATIADVLTQVERTIEYERGRHIGDWFLKATGVASNLGPGHHGEYDHEHIGYIRDDLLLYGFTHVDEIYDPGATASQVSAALNDGRRIVNYAGHGTEIDWTTSHFSIADVDNLTNDNRLPHIVAVGCNNGKFNLDTCFAEAFLRATNNGEPTGAVAMWASSAKMSWSPPMTAQDEVVDLFVAEAMKSYGGLCFAGAIRMMIDWGQAGRDDFDNWIVFGDPSLTVRPGPEVLAIDFPEELPDRVPPGAEIGFPVMILDGSQQYVTGTATIHYRMDPAASYATAQLASLGGGLFEAAIPAPMPGDALEFFISADGNGGTTVTSPDNAPATVYAAPVGIVRNILCDNFEKDKGWTVQNVNLKDGAWVRVDPIGTTFLNHRPQLNYDNPLGTGTHCYVTGQGQPGGGPTAADVDGGPTRLISPLMDISTGGRVSFFYHFYNAGLDDSLEVFLSNDDGATWTRVAEIKHSPGLHFMSIDVADHVTPTAKMRLLFSTKDQPDNSITEAAIDDVVVERFITDPSLWADAYTMSAAAGAIVTYTLDGDAANAHRDYILLGSLTGTSPGYPLPGGGGTFPVNWDSLTSFILNSPASTTFVGFHGQLDASGRATAVFDTQGPVTQSWLVGRVMTFAFAAGKPWNYASTPVTLVVYP